MDIEARKQLKRATLTTQKEEGLFGLEINNPVPVAVPVKLSGGLSLKERIDRLMRASFQKQMAERQIETEDEMMDFDVDDDFDREAQSFYELADEMPPEPPPPDVVEELEKPIQPEPEPDPPISKE